MDLQQGFYQVRMKESDVHKTAFYGDDGLYEMLVMPMGLCNSPSTFQRLMRLVITSDMDRFALVYLDDILVFSSSAEDHLRHVEEVLKRLRLNQLFVKRSKCEFGAKKIKFVGHIIEDGKRKIDPDRIVDIRQIPTPRTASEIRSFMGAINFVRDHLPKASEISAPLLELVRKGVRFLWGERQQSAFDKLKQLVARNMELHLPDPDLPWLLETDASLTGLGAALYQTDKDHRKLPVCFSSHRLEPRERNYPTHERELYAIVFGCSNFRHYLEGVSFTVHTDHYALKFLQTQPNLSRRVSRWVEYLQRFDQAILYIKGAENGMADLLSRLPVIQPTEEANLQPLEAIGREENEDIVQDLARPIQELDDPNWPLLLLADRLPPETSGEFREFLVAQRRHFVYEDGVLYRKLAGDIRVKFVPFAVRADLVRSPAIVTGTPEGFQRWGIDAIGPLPESRSGHKFIIHAKDYATKWAVSEVTAKSVATVIYEAIFLQFGPPAEIVSDLWFSFLCSGPGKLPATTRDGTLSHLRVSPPIQWSSRERSLDFDKDAGKSLQRGDTPLGRVPTRGTIPPAPTQKCRHRILAISISIRPGAHITGRLIGTPNDL
jgi:hypothetical protein